MTVQNAIVFASDSDFCVRTTNLLNMNNPFAVTLWAYPTSWAFYAHFWAAIVGTQQAGDYVNSDMVGHDPSNPALSRIAAYSGGSGSGPTGAALTLNTWQFLGLVRESTTSLKLYINGNTTAAITDTQSISGRGAVGSVLLSRLHGAYGMRGRIACVKEFSASKTGTQIAAEKDYWNATDLTNHHETWNFPTGGSRAVGNVNGYAWTENGTITDATGPDLAEYGAGGGSPSLLPSNPAAKRNRLLHF